MFYRHNILSVHLPCFVMQDTKYTPGGALSCIITGLVASATCSLTVCPRRSVTIIVTGPVIPGANTTLNNPSAGLGYTFIP